MLLQTTLPFAAPRKANAENKKPSLDEDVLKDRKRESETTLATPASKRFTTAADHEAITHQKAQAREPLKVRKSLGPINPFFCRDVCVSNNRHAALSRKYIESKLFCFASRHNPPTVLYEGYSSLEGGQASNWMRGLQMLSNFGVTLRIVPVVISISHDGELALFFRPGYKNMAAEPRQALYEGTSFSEPAFMTSANPIQDVSWSSRAPGKVAVCSSSTSDVEVWNAHAYRKEATLNGQTQVTSGPLGFLAVHTIKDAPHMLAAGGYGGAVQLWDARASKRASMSLPLHRNDVITRVLCVSNHHCILAGTSSGSLTYWDTRKINTNSLHVFGARGPTQGDINMTSSAKKRALTALCQTLPLTTPAYPSKVNHLEADPTDSSRVAFSLARGSAGVMNVRSGTVTHVFNPYLHQARTRNTDPAVSRCHPRDMAWSSDGKLLYHVLPHRVLPMASDDDEPVIASDVDNREGWNKYSVHLNDSGSRRPICALDVTSDSALRCSEAGSSQACHGEAVPFHFELETCANTTQSLAEGEQAFPESAGDDVNVFKARFAVLPNSEYQELSEDTDGDHSHEKRKGLCDLPPALQAGVTFSWDGVEDGSTLALDSLERNVLICQRARLSAILA